MQQAISTANAPEVSGIPAYLLSREFLSFTRGDGSSFPSGQKVGESAIRFSASQGGNGARLPARETIKGRPCRSPHRNEWRMLIVTGPSSEPNGFGYLK